MTLKKVILVLSIHFSAMLPCFWFSIEEANAKKKIESPKTQSLMVATQEDKKVLVIKPRKDEKTILCTDEKAQRVRITFGRMTTINFPTTPKEVLPGSTAAFDFMKIRNDLNILALRSNAKTNVVVYLQERRCSLDLTTVPIGGDDNLFVRDPAEKQFEVRFQ